MIFIPQCWLQVHFCLPTPIILKIVNTTRVHSNCLLLVLLYSSIMLLLKFHNQDGSDSPVETTLQKWSVLNFNCFPKAAQYLLTPLTTAALTSPAFRSMYDTARGQAATRLWSLSCKPPVTSWLGIFLCETTQHLPTLTFICHFSSNIVSRALPSIHLYWHHRALTWASQSLWKSGELPGLPPLHRRCWRMMLKKN